MKDSLEEIMFILAPDIRYIKECKYLSDQEREELSGKIDKALDLLIECSDFIDKKRKEVTKAQ